MESESWVARQRHRYREDGFGLWLVEDRRSGAFVGTVGPAIQEVEGERLVEIGWHVRPGMKGAGFASEAARATNRLGRSRTSTSRT